MNIQTLNETINFYCCILYIYHTHTYVYKQVIDTYDNHIHNPCETQNTKGYS